MKKSIFLTMTLLSCIIFSYAQDTLPQKLIKFRATLRTMKFTMQKGYLFGMSDSSIQISKAKEPVRFYGLGNNPENKKINYYDIDFVSIRRHNSIGRGAAIGGITGAVVLGLIAAISTGGESADTWQIISPGAQIAGGAILGAITGAGVGILIGSLAHKRFIIHGKKERFEKMRDEMMSRLTYK